MNSSGPQPVPGQDTAPGWESVVRATVTSAGVPPRQYTVIVMSQEAGPPRNDRDYPLAQGIKAVVEGYGGLPDFTPKQIVDDLLGGSFPFITSIQIVNADGDGFDYAVPETTSAT